MGLRHLRKLRAVTLILGVWVSFFKGADGCGDIGAVNPGSFTDTTGNHTDQTFFVESPASTCCGTLKNWKFFASGSGDLTTLLWRPKTGANYELIATNTFTVAVGLSTPIPASLVEVQTGDVIGWETSGGELIPSNVAAGSTTQNQLLAAVSIGSDVPWSGITDTANTYAFGAVVDANELPVVVGDEITITEAETSQSIHTVDITDTDSIDITADTFSVSMTGDSAFSLVKTVTGYDIETGASLTSGTYELAVTATDRCSESASATVTVTVTNDEPVFSPYPLLDVHPISISDATTSATSLYRFSVTDTDAVTCTSDNSLFEIRTVSSDFELWLKSITDTDLNYDTATSQPITITCTDDTASITSTYTVNISDEPPVISNLAGTTGPISDLSPAGTTIHQFTVTDQDDVISCSVDSPEDAVFQINALDGSSGTQRFEIETISTVNEDTQASYAVSVSCTDSQNPDVTGSRTVTLTDDPPVLTGLPATSVALFDGTQTAATLGTFSATDANDQGLLACTIQAPGSALFSVAAGTTPEFEISVIGGVTLATGTYNLNIDCDDDEATNTVSGVFSVPVSDEPPVFVGTFPSNSPDLSDDVDTETSLAAFTVSEAVTCSVTNPAGSVYETRAVGASGDTEFEIWVSNSVSEADVDYNDQAVPLSLTITCSDGTTDISETFGVNIVDASPSLSGLPGTDYDAISDDTTTELYLDVFTVTDSDDTVTCSIDAGDPSASLFEIRTGTAPDFEIWLSAGASLNAATTPSYTLPITCTDGETDVTGTKTVNIANSPPVFVNLPDATATISEDVTSKTSIYAVTASDKSELTCYLTDAASAAVDEIPAIEKNSYTAPNTVYDVYGYISSGFDFETSTGTVTVDITCDDGQFTISDTLTVNVVNAAPEILNPDGSTTISESETGEVPLKTLSIAPFDELDTTCTLTSDDGGPFVLSGFELKKTAGTLDFETQSTYNLQIECTDGTLTTTDTYTVDVENVAPEITNLPSGTSGDINENQVDELMMYGLELTEDATSCDQVAPIEGEFTVKVDTATNLWSIYYVGSVVAGQSLSFTTKPSYDINVACTDGTNTGSTQTFTANVIENRPPYFTNVAGNSVWLRALDVSSGDTVFTVEGQDDDGDPITFSKVACTPACPFTVSSNGEIKATTDLHAFPESRYVMQVLVEDAYNPNQVFGDLIIEILDGCGDIGAINPGSHIDATGAQTGQTFFVESPASLCCGTLKNWKFYASATGDLTTMLWRPTTGANYELIATNTFTVAVGLSTPIPASLVEVQTGDVIGWETSGAELIPSSAGSSTTTQNQLLAAVSVGSDVPWSGTQDTTNTYAFGAVVEANTAPVVNGDAFSIGEADVSQSIHTVDITDTDSIDITADTFSVSMTGDSAFSLVKTVTGYDIETGASLTSGTYELVVTATDRCSESASATVTVTVTNDAPVFNPDPLLDVHPISISDATTSATSLYRFSVTDTDAVTCLSDNSLFEIQTVTTNVYELWLKSIADADLNYDTATSQVITISCTDSSTSISSTYTVNISDEPPVISSLSGTTGPISDLSPAGTSIHQFTVTDQDDVISCSVDAPEDVVFSITALDGSAGTQRFEIETASTVNEDTAASYTVGISCTDLQNPDVTGSRLVTLTDDPPVLDGLPATSAALFDGTQTAAVLGTFSVTDANDQGIIACAVQAPNAGLFSVAAGTVPEFEVSVIDGVTLSTGTYDLDIDCDDDEAVNTVSGVFSVPVTDEPPAFVGTFPSDSADLSDDTTVETSLAAFTVSEAVTCSVTDPAGTIYETRTSDPLQQAFEIWVANTVTEADINFNDQAVPLTLTITCSDGTTDITETFNVNIVDAVPTLTGLPGTDYDGIYDNTTTELFLDTFDVTDSDDTVTCSIDAGDPSASLFEIRSGTAPEFEIWLSAGASLDFATTPSYDLPITCSDGDNSVTGTKTVLILNTPPDVTVEPEITDPVSDSLDVRTLLARVRSTATCTHSADAPYDNDFQFRKTGAEVYQILVNAGNNLNYDVDPFVIITFTCTDGISTATATYNLTLFDEDPVMTGLPDIFQSLSDEDTARTLLHTFTMSDSDDTITCVVDPATPEASFFEVVAGTAPDFEIYFLGSPPTTLDAATTPFYNLSITCDDGAIYQLNTTYDVEVEDAPPVFLNLPASTPSIAENVITKTPLYTVTATDKSELTCYLADTVTAAGIPPLEFNSYTDPNTVYDVYGYHTTGFDFEGTGGTVTVDITCGDQSSTVTDTLTINIINSAPEILNPGGSTIISESETGELSLKTLSIQKFDEPDTTCTLTNDDGGPFALTGFELKKTAGTLDFETQSTYNLQIECTDGTLTTTDTYTVDVENLAPEITNLPTKGSIDESQEAELLLFGIELTEDATSCDQVAPIDDEFIVKFEPTTNLWSIYYVSSAVAGKSLDHSVTDVYEIGVACTDGTSTGETKIYTIDVNENKAPEFTNVLGNPVTKVSISAKDVNATDTAFTVLAEDDELDLITYSLVGCEVNATCPFIMTPNGDIVATSDLHTDPEFQYTLQVMAEDDYNKNETIKTLIIEILDRNTPPELTNLPRLDVVGVEENNAAGDVVFDINHEDPDIGDTVKYFCNFPDGGNAFFACNEDTGEVTALNAIDYEQMTRLEYRVETYVNDGYADSATETFKLRIKDVNEPPEFQTTQWTVTKADEGGPGQEVDCPKFSDDIRDEDINDVLSYTMSCPDGNGVFVMDSSTGCITMTEEWDLDLPSKRLARETIQCTVVATDQGGNTTEAQLDIVIKESDDNIPYTDQTSYIYCAQQGTSGGGMGQITTSDNDVLAKHRQYTYDFTGGGPFSSDGNGVVTYGDLSNYALGTSFDSTLRVTDDGGNFSETPVTVMICDEETYRSYMTSNSVSNTNTNTNSGSSSSSSTSSSGSDMDWLYWLIPALLLGALLAGLLAYLIRRCCLSGRCGQRWVKGGKFGGGRMVRGGAAGGGGMKMRKVTVMRRRVVMGQQGGGYSQTGAYSNLQEAGSPPGTATQNGTPAVGNGNAQKAITPPKPASPPTPAANGTGNQPVQPLPKREPGTIAPMELPITHYYARDVGNLGGAYPT